MCCSAMKQVIPQLIDGQWQASHARELIEVTDPATQEAWQCRVVANPLGYARKGEQATFQSKLCLTV